jgi:hypothetical protein
MVSDEADHSYYRLYVTVSFTFPATALFHEFR